MAGNLSPLRDIRSEAHGPHWIAWRSDANGRPEGAIVMVGETRDEAEARAAQWEERKTLQAAGTARPSG